MFGEYFLVLFGLECKLYIKLVFLNLPNISLAPREETMQNHYGILQKKLFPDPNRHNFTNCRLGPALPFR